ncbi:MULTISPECIES: SDR family oxidoreductase [unclassified Brevibacterium]|uniref:SDR family NAD(P)-dependent oxidoreductase n=1 Tax=unclassified Brevibacterium TaxID=2614124 RepID=UPI0010F6B4BC|nr:MULTISPECIES: SDR family oxidoreductase [unclassified Brevibacterium]MCM1012755.1 SDR family oxidoreductase [Brevibacterium sp. XM4083]
MNTPSNANYELAGKLALVTGGGVGIGASIAESLAARGARVAVTYRSHRPDDEALARLISIDGQEPVAVAADLTVEAEVANLGAQIESIGGVDILVNNAGGLIQRSTIAEMSYELFRRVQVLNVDSTFLVTKRMLPLMGAGGRIITVASLAGRSGGHAGATAYATSKAALFGFTRGLASEVAERGITVNAVAPGFIEATPFHDTFTSPESKSSTVAGIPVGRAGVPADVAHTVAWLASPSSSFVTGAIVDVNGGQFFS